MEGVSTRRVDDLVKAMGIEEIAKSEVSRIAGELDGKVAEFRERPLDAGPCRYLWIDALTQKVREGGRVVNVSAVVGTSVSAEGRREIIGFDVFTSETTESWTEFLRGLVERGLGGVELVITSSRWWWTGSPRPGSSTRPPCCSTLRTTSWRSLISRLNIGPRSVRTTPKNARTKRSAGAPTSWGSSPTAKLSSVSLALCWPNRPTNGRLGNATCQRKLSRPDGRTSHPRMTLDRRWTPPAASSPPETTPNPFNHHRRRLTATPSGAATRCHPASATRTDIVGHTVLARPHSSC